MTLLYHLGCAAYFFRAHHTTVQLTRRQESFFCLIYPGRFGRACSAEPNRLGYIDLRNQLVDHTPFNIRQPEIAPRIAVRKPLVIESQEI
jgi:hypothetical protein